MTNIVNTGNASVDALAEMLDYSNENIKQLIRERKWSDS